MRKCILLFILAVVSLRLHAQEIKAIKLKQQRISYAPRNFYVTGVKDDRVDTTNIGSVRVGLANKRAILTLKNGTANSINDFIQNNLDQNNSAKSIELHITQLEAAEKAVGGREQADVTFGIAFYSSDIKLIEYTGTGYIQSGIDVTGYIEKLIRQNIERGLTDFDKWLEENKESLNPQKELSVTVVMQGDTADTDLILYDKSKPLQREDFAGAFDELSLGDAATYSIIYLKYLYETQGNRVKLKVMLSSAFDKTKSWWRAQTANKAVLEHEQHHFDIAAIKICELAELIRSTNFSMDNYGKELEAMHRKISKEMQQMQDQYDKETKHGTVKAEQERWNREISDRVSQLSCY